MKAKSSIYALTAASLAFAGSLLLLDSEHASAKPPFTSDEKAQQEAELMKAVEMGYNLWHSPELGTNGLACGNCHPDAAATNPHTWPKYQTNLNKVGTLREMINWCITVPLAGQPLALDSDKMIAMEAYATFMHRGIPISLGKDEQNGGDPVKSGRGFPNDNTGNR